MCLPKEVFLSLCSVYPETAQSLRMKAEERHKWILKVRKQCLAQDLQIDKMKQSGEVQVDLDTKVIQEAIQKMQKRARLRERTKSSNSVFEEIRARTTICFGNP